MTGGVREIPLTKGQVALVDEEDYERVNAFKWYAFWNKSAKSFYAVRTEYYKGKKSCVYLHRFIMNAPQGMECDHINLNTLDTRKINLRICTRSQNQMNRHVRKNNKLGVKGIYAHRNSFQASIWLKSKRVWLKTFPTLEEAIAARKEAVKKYHGEFACTE